MKNIPFPQNYEECESVFMLYHDKKSERINFYHKGRAESYFKARKMYYEALRGVFFTVAKFEDLKGFHQIPEGFYNLYFGDTRKMLCGDGGDRQYFDEDVHRMDILKILISARKLVEICYFLDRFDECMEMADIVIDICEKFHKNIFALKNYSRHGNRNLIIVKSVLSKYFTLRKNFSIARKYIEEIKNTDGVSLYQYSGAINILQQFTSTDGSSKNTDPRFSNCTPSAPPGSPEDYSEYCLKKGYKEKDEWSAKPFRLFLGRAFGINYEDFDDLEEERIGYMLEMCSKFPVSFEFGNELFVPKLLLVFH